MSVLTPDYELSVLNAHYAFNGVVAGTFETPTELDTIKSVGLAEQKATGTIYASGKVLKTISRQNATQITVGATALPTTFKRRALGRTASTVGGFAAASSNDVPAEFAFGFAAEYSSGLQKFVWYPRCTLMTADSTVETKKEGAEDPNSSFVIMAVPYGTGNIIEVAYDQKEATDAGKVPLTAAEFFAAVITSLDAAIVDTEAAGTTPAALSYTISPVDGATHAKAANVVLTFNNAIASAYVSVIAAVTGEVFATTQTWDAARKVLTLAHAPFAATTAYVVAVNGATDVYGQVLANSATDFTTGS